MKSPRTKQRNLQILNQKVKKGEMDPAVEEFWASLAESPLLDDLLAHLFAQESQRNAVSPSLHLYSHQMGAREGFREALDLLKRGPLAISQTNSPEDPYKVFRNPPIRTNG